MLYFTDHKTEAQKGSVTFPPKLYSYAVAKPGLESKITKSKSGVSTHYVLNDKLLGNQIHTQNFRITTFQIFRNTLDF